MKKTGASPIVVGTGLIALDLVVVENDRQPSRAWAGGTCGNVLTILSYLGWDSYPIGRLGLDPASELVSGDLSRWGVHLDFLRTNPTAFAPIIVQLIKNKNGSPVHRFLWSCPHCGKHLPSYRPVTAEGLESIQDVLPCPQVCFLDRVSRAALNLAEWASQKGAVIVFEPSGKCEPKLFNQALKLSHILKYSSERYGEIDALQDRSSSVLLEIQTAGIDGLRFKSRLSLSESANWTHLPAVQTTRLVDSCGAGDWSTAGLISGVCRQGLDGLLEVDSLALTNSLIFGQALSAWNCGFEGARGAMYSGERPPREFAQISSVTSQRQSAWLNSNDSNNEGVRCPACQDENRELALSR